MKKNIIISFLSLVNICTTPLCAQESCFGQYLRDHNMPFLTAEDANDSYEELKKTAIAYERMSEEAAKTRRAAEQPNPATQCAQSEPTFLPIFLAIDTLTGTCHLLAEDGTILADAQLAMVDSTWYMWLSVDPLADKYPVNTPYLYCGGNPIHYVDHHGDSLSVSESDRQDVNTFLSSAYGEAVAKHFNYTSTGQLIYGGNIKDIKNIFIRSLVREFNNKLLSSTDMVSLVILSKDMRIPSGELLSSYGGAAFLPETNTIYLNRNADNSFIVQSVLPVFYEKNGVSDGFTELYKPQIIQTNSTDLFFHEVGEYIYRNSTGDKVIDFNNKYRHILKLGPRPYDETHNRLTLTK